MPAKGAHDGTDATELATHNFKVMLPSTPVHPQAKRPDLIPPFAAPLGIGIADDIFGGGLQPSPTEPHSGAH